MGEFLLQHEREITSLSFFWMLSLAAAMENFWPKRAIEWPMLRRWLANAGIQVAGSMCAWLLIPVTGVGLASICQQQGLGLFNTVSAPVWLVAPVSLLTLDCISYLRHMALHRAPWLWRFHRSHHTDTSIDFSTQLRFHPFEMFFSIAVSFAAIALLGVPGYVLVLNILLTQFAGLFTHSNLAIPEHGDRIIRLFIVTPDMHRVHHSSDVRETNSNYGNILPWWDRMFGTYWAQPRGGHQAMQLGLPEFQNAKYGKLHWMLWMPFAPLAQAGEIPSANEI